jgi:CheY-like chemotaxis protein
MARPPHKTHDAEPIRTIRLPEDELRRLLDDLDTADAPSSNASASKRYRYRVPDLQIELLTQGSSAVRYALPTRWISEKAVGFLHGGFVHANTGCRAHLTTLYGGTNCIDGRVRSCRYVQQGIHEIDVALARRLTVAHYCAEAVQRRVLVAEGDALTARMLGQVLRTLNADVEQVSDGASAVEQCARSQFDVVLMNLNLPVMDGFTATQQLRARGYVGPIVALLGRAPDADRQRLEAAGFDMDLHEPYDRKALTNLLESLRCEPVFSSLSEDPDMQEIIDEFVNSLGDRIQSIQQALRDADEALLRQVLDALKQHGAAVGFEAITRQADEIARALDNGKQVAQTRAVVQALLRTCGRAQGATDSA